MSKPTTNSEIIALVEALQEHIKTPAEGKQLTDLLQKNLIEAALGAEMAEHLGYTKHAAEGHHSGNKRNGHSRKNLKHDRGEFEIEVPRDRNGTFEPQLVKKNQTRLTDFDDKVIALYARGMSTRDIVGMFKELYGADISPTLVSNITDPVMEQVVEWQSRPIDPIYPIVYLDCIVIKIRQDKRVINKAVYLALGINIEGQKELLGLWIAETEGAKFWLSVLTELQNRGLKDIFIACVDGLKGFPDAINTAYPDTKIQLCIVHMVRNSLKFVSLKDRKAVATDLKAIYQAISVEQAEQALSEFEEKWDDKFPSIAKSWRSHWPNLITLFDYPADIRKVIYTTNAIESLNSVIRKSIKTRKLFPNDQSATKVVYLAIQAASKKWTMPIRNWNAALNRFIPSRGTEVIEFPERMPDII